MRILNTHERLVRRPLPEVFADLVALGTPEDRIWPEPTMPFRRTAGPMRVGVTRERHGAIQAVLMTFEENRRIVWRADLSFLQGTHAFEVQEVGRDHTLARHVVQASLPWWFTPVWQLWMSGKHNQIVEGLFERLARSTAPMEASV
jgi:hypothetical protein